MSEKGDTELAQALRLIVEWKPPQVESRGEMVPMGVAIGSKGERDYFRRIAQEAIAAHHTARAQQDELAKSRIGLYGGRRVALEDMANTPETQQKLRDLLDLMERMEAHDKSKSIPPGCEPDEPKSDPRAQPASVYAAHPSGDGSIVRKGDGARLSVDEILAAMNMAQPASVADLSRAAEPVGTLHVARDEYGTLFQPTFHAPDELPVGDHSLYMLPPEPVRDAKDDRIAELEAANVGLADESVRLQEALRFYAEHKHMLGFDRWDSASGEAGNWLCDPSHSPAMVEDGWVAREALAPIDAPIKAVMAQENDHD